MKELDNNFIEAFAAQYWNQAVVKLDCFDSLYLVKPLNWLKYYQCERFKYIELRSIDDFTDEELDKVAEYEATCSMDIQRLNHILDCLYAETSDYLRSIGIAVPFRNVSVETIIESGKLKLRKS